MSRTEQVCVTVTVYHVTCTLPLNGHVATTAKNLPRRTMINTNPPRRMASLPL